MKRVNLLKGLSSLILLFFCLAAAFKIVIDFRVSNFQRVSASPLIKTLIFYENKPDKFLSLFRELPHKRDREYFFSSAIKSGVLAYSETSSEETILHLIFRKNLKHKERKFLLQNILKAGADPNKRNLLGNTAGDLLIELKSPQEEGKSYLRYLLDYNLDCNARRKGIPFLQRIVSKNEPATAKTYLKICLLYGADPLLKDPKGKSLFDEIALFEDEGMKQDFRQTVFEVLEFNYRKLLANAFAIPGNTVISDGEANLEGLLVSLSHRKLNSLDTEFYEGLAKEIEEGKGKFLQKVISNSSKSMKEKFKLFSDHEKKELANILIETNRAMQDSLSYWHKPKKEVAEKIQKGELVALKASASQHLYGFVVYKNKLYVCNKGYFYLQTPGVIKLDINNADELPLFLSHLTSRMPVEVLFKKEDPEGRTYLEKLIDSRSRTVYIIQNLQTVGNCTFVNTSSMQYAILNILLEERLGLKVKERKELAHVIKSLSKLHRREKLLQEYIAFHMKNEGSPLDFHLLVQIGTKTTESSLHDLFNRTLLANWLVVGGKEFIQMNLAKNYRFKVNSYKKPFPKKGKTLQVTKDREALPRQGS